MIFSRSQALPGTLPDLTVELVPATDGISRLSDPTGAYNPNPGIELPAPYNLRTISKTDSSMTIGWDYLEQGQTGFFVYKFTAGAWNLIGDVGPSIRRWTSDNLAAETNHGFQIRAYHDDEV